MNNQLPEKLIRCRRHYNVSQKQVAAHCGVDLVEYMSWENGRAIPSIEQSKCLASLFRISLDDMFSNKYDIFLPEFSEPIIEEEIIPTVNIQREFDDEDEIEETQEIKKVKEVEKKVNQANGKKTKNSVSKVINDKILIIIGVLALLVAVIYFGYNMLKPKNELTGIEVINTIDTNERVVAGDDFVLVLNTDGKVKGYGINNYGQTSVSDWVDITSLTVGNGFSAGLVNNGTVKFTGQNSYNIDPELFEKIISLKAGNNHLVGLTAENVVVCQGDNSKSQCDVTEWENIDKIAAGGNATIGIDTENNIFVAGDLIVDKAIIEAWEDVSDITISDNAVIGITNSHKVYCAAEDKNMCEGTADWEDVISVHIGEDHIVGLMSNGRMIATGSNTYGQLDVLDFKNIVSIAAGKNFSVGLNRENELVGAGLNDYNIFEEIEIDETQPLDKVENITVTNGSVVEIKWDRVPYASYYEVRIDSIGFVVKVADLSVTVQNSKFVDGQSYVVAIIAYTTGDTQQPSEESSTEFTFIAPIVTPTPTPTPTPTEDPIVDPEPPVDCEVNPEDPSCSTDPCVLDPEGPDCNDGGDEG